MKRLISTVLMLVVLAMAVPALAQRVTMTNPNGSATDTITNTTAEGPYARVAGDLKEIGFTLTLTSLTGTVAGKVYLQGGRSSTVWDYPYLDSVTLTAGSNSWQFNRQGFPFEYARLYVVPTGTQSTSYTAVYYIRKQ